MKIVMTKEWCARMAHLEEGADISAGVVAADPVFEGDPVTMPVQQEAPNVDLEKTRRCAGAMGLTVHESEGALYLTREDLAPWSFTDDYRFCDEYAPLTDDAQAMALAKRFRLSVAQLSGGVCKVFTPDLRHQADAPGLNRAIVECVGQMRERPA